MVWIGRRSRLLLVAACFSICAAVHASAETSVAPGTLKLQGHLVHPRVITLAELQAMPALTVDVTHSGHNGPQTDHYTGVPLWALLQAAEPIDENGPRTHLQHTLRATGADGYTVALAIGEVEPDFEGKQVLVAYTENGRTLPSLKLVVPADVKAGRSVRDLVSIELD